MDNVLTARLQNPTRDKLAESGLYHSFRLPNGVILQGSLDLAVQEERLASFGLPDDLTGKRVLDIGPWDGYYTFEMERRGAEVVAIDYVDLDTFRALHRAFRSSARYLRMDIYEISPETLGTFDIVLCLGVLYHLKHPLLALEKVCSVTRDVCIIDTFVIDGSQYQQGVIPPLPYVEFYENDQLGGQIDNWSGPTVTAVEAWVRAAGFARARLLKVVGNTARLAADRLWNDLPDSVEGPLTIRGISSHLNRGRTFHSSKEQYLAIWCEAPGPDCPPLEVVFPEIDGYGIAPLSCHLTNNGLHINCRLPAGLCAGTHYVRLKLGSSSWSEPVPFYLDLPLAENEIVLRSVQDGLTWRSDVVDWDGGGWMTLWVSGLTAEADPGNTTIYVNDIPHTPDAVDPAHGQINVCLRPVIAGGNIEVSVEHRGARSNAKVALLTGTAPRIRGLEDLHSLL